MFGVRHGVGRCRLGVVGLWEGMAKQKGKEGGEEEEGGLPFDSSLGSVLMVSVCLRARQRHCSCPLSRRRNLPGTCAFSGSTRLSLAAYILVHVINSLLGRLESYRGSSRGQFVDDGYRSRQWLAPLRVYALNIVRRCTI